MLEVFAERSVICTVAMNRAVAQESFSKTDIRQLIKFHVLLKKSPTETYGILQEGLEDNCPSYETVRKWHKMFCAGSVEVEDADRSGRPSTACDEDHIARVSALLEEDNRYTCEELASEIGVSSSSIHIILTDKLKKRKIAAKWIPHVLTDQQLNDRMRICASHLRRYRREGNSFLHRIIAGDETWARSFEPELKSQSAQWLDRGDPRPSKAIRSPSRVKSMHIVFFDVQGLLIDHAVPPGTTVTGNYYIEFIRKHLRPAIRRKRPDLLQQGPIILHDNAPAHTKREVVQLFNEEYDWEILQHPAYSPDLSPCDFFFFPNVKNELRGRRFSTVEDVNDAFHRECTALARRGCSNGIDGLVKRWRKCVDLHGHYTE